jgi:hypothetical protein
MLDFYYLPLKYAVPWPVWYVPLTVEPWAQFCLLFVRYVWWSTTRVDFVGSFIRFPLLIFIPPLFHTHLSLPPEVCTNSDKITHSRYFGEFIRDLGLGWLQSKSFCSWRYLAVHHCTKRHSWVVSIPVHVCKVWRSQVSHRLPILSFCFVLHLAAVKCLEVGHASFLPYFFQFIIHRSEVVKINRWKIMIQ